MSKTCQVWYQTKGFDKYNLTKPVLKVFVVIWVKGQGQSRSGPKNKVKIQNCPKHVKFGQAYETEMILEDKNIQKKVVTSQPSSIGIWL